jgi:hypothetical protein
MRVPLRSFRGRSMVGVWRREPVLKKLALYKPIKPQPALLPPPVPTVRNQHGASSWAAGALAASQALHGVFERSVDTGSRSNQVCADCVDLSALESASNQTRACSS